MSQYMNVFVRDKDNFVELMSYCRNSEFYQMMKDSLYIPYEKIKCVTFEELTLARADMAKEIVKINKHEEEITNKIKLISNWNNSIEEKLEVIEHMYELLEELYERKEDIKNAISTLHVLADIADNRQYIDGNERYKSTIYIGIEIGDPTVEDIV